jgi:predicted nucleic acid-binding protein
LILLDTDVCVSLLRGNAAIADRIRASSSGASVSFMTAAVAMDRGLVLATGNLKHFTRIPGLMAQDWLA